MKSKKASLVICVGFILLLMCTAEVRAVVYYWNSTVEGASWLDAGNWNPNGQPNSSDTAAIDTLPGPTLYSGTGGAYAVEVSYSAGSVGQLDLRGGSLNAPGGLDVGYQIAGGTGTLNIYDGNHSCRYLVAGGRGHGTFNMYGGYIRVTNTLRIGYYASGTGHVNLDGGVVSAVNILMAREAGTPSTMLVKNGVLLLDGDKTTLMLGYINNGWITASDENYELVLEYNGSRYPGVTALYTLYNDLQMIPNNHATVPRSTNLLQWTLPDPNDTVTPSIVTCDVYFGTDPNILLDPKIVSKQAVESVSVTLAANTVYYWKVDVYDSDINGGATPYFQSRVFTFNTFNVAPTVNAGQDIQTWWPGSSRTVQLNGSVVDADNFPSPATQTWTMLSEPDALNNPAVINNPDIVNPTVALNAIGTYVLQLEGTDGEYPVSDTMQIVLYPDACTHASNQPGFTWLAGDFNHDCRVNIFDFSQLSSQWLELNYSLE